MHPKCKLTLSSRVLTETLPSQSGSAADVPPYSHWTAAELALAISGGDSKAEAEFYRRYYPSLHYVLEIKTGLIMPLQCRVHSRLCAVQPLTAIPTTGLRMC